MQSFGINKNFISTFEKYKDYLLKQKKEWELQASEIL